MIEWVGLEGGRHREVANVGTKKEAQDLLNTRLGEVSKARLLGVTSVNMIRPKRFSEFLEEEYMPHCKANHSPATYRGDTVLQKQLNREFGNRNLRDISKGDVQQFVNRSVGRIGRHGRPIRPATVNRARMFLSGIMKEALNREYVDRNPVKGIKMLKEHNDKLRFLSIQEESRLMALLPDYLVPIVVTALNTGLRLGEGLRLTWSDLDFEHRLVRATRTKNHKIRYIPMNDRLFQTLSSVPPYAGPFGVSPYVFTNAATGKAYNSVTHALQKAAKKASVLDINFHTLRHTFASRLAQSGVPINTIRELLGHGSLEVTLRYAHLSQKDHRSAVDVLMQVQDSVKASS